MTKQLIFEQLKRIDGEMAQQDAAIDSLMAKLRQARIDYAALHDERDRVQTDYDLLDQQQKPPGEMVKL